MKPFDLSIDTPLTTMVYCNIGYSDGVNSVSPGYVYACPLAEWIAESLYHIRHDLGPRTTRTTFRETIFSSTKMLLGSGMTG